MNKVNVPLLKPSIPDKELFGRYLDEIWNSGILTNGGNKSLELEARLAEFLCVPYVSLYSNATLALIAALKVLGVRGEVITSPFTFVATANAILNAGLTPVFVDIDPRTLNLDPQLVAQGVSSETGAIMPVHVYGNPCEVFKFEEISTSSRVPIIYDAAQAFAVDIDGESVLNHGDLSVVSLHSTKVFSTLEGGLIVTKSHTLKKKLDQFKNFGLVDQTSLSSIGLNSKLNEVQCAVGLANLTHVKLQIEQRKHAFELYKEELSKIPGITVYTYLDSAVVNYNYMPIIIDENCTVSRDVIASTLTKAGIGCRKYFSPLIHKFNGLEPSLYRVEGVLENASKAANQVLCLPMYPGISSREIISVCTAIMKEVCS